MTAAGAADGGRPAGAILAGGRARRSGGRAKGLELVGGVRIVDALIAALREVAAEVVLVGAPPAVTAAVPAIRNIPDAHPGDGPLGGIVSALRATGRDTLIVAWDMPFVTATQLAPLVEAGGDAEAAVWEVDGRVEPLCGLYRRAALAPLEAAFDAGERSPREALRRLTVHLVRRGASDGPSAFTSVNTAEQLDAARLRISSNPNPRDTC